jgi:hypothetical protein
MLKYSPIRFLLSLVSIAVLMLSFSCKHKQTIEPVKPQEVYDVINTVIKERRLDTTQWKPNWPLRLIQELWKIDVDFPEPKIKDDTLKHERSPGTMDYNELLTTVFSREDSVFFAYQNIHNNKFILQPGKIKLIKLMSDSAFIKSQYMPTRYSEISFSIPIFSLDHQKAWIGAMGPWEYYLIKTNDIWRIKIMKKRWALAGEREHIETQVLF